MIEIFSLLYLGHNYRGHKGIYFLTINGRPRRKLSHQRCYKFQLFLKLCLCFLCSFQELHVVTRTQPLEHPLLFT